MSKHNNKRKTAGRNKQSARNRGGNKAVGNQTTENKAAGNQTAENKAAESQPPENQTDGNIIKPDSEIKCKKKKTGNWKYIIFACIFLGIVLICSIYKHTEIVNDELSRKVESEEINNIMKSILSKDDSSDLRVDILMQAIVLYTTQLEDYDKDNITAGMSCIGFIGLIITAVGTVLATTNENNSSFSNQAIAVVLLFVPEMFILFLYNFAMANRRSAIFRGYLMFLEEVLNKELGVDYMLFNQQLIPKQLSSFSVNTQGPIVLAVFLLIFMILFFGISYYFAQRSENNIFFRVYYGFFIALASICIFCSCWYGAYLRTNGAVIDNAKATCEQNLNNMTLIEVLDEAAEPDNLTEQN